MRLTLCTITARRPAWFGWWHWNVAKQTRAPDEIVVVGDGTWPAVDGVRHVWCDPSATTGARRNLAAEHATGDHLVFFDDDDWYAPTTVERLGARCTDALVGIRTLTWYAPRHRRFAREQTKWAHHPFVVPRAMALAVGWPDLLDGEDLAFYRRCPRVLIDDLLYVGIQHDRNVFNRDTRAPPALSHAEGLAVLGAEADPFFARLAETLAREAA